MGQIESLRQGMSDISVGLKDAVDADDRAKISALAEDLANMAANGAPDIPFPMLPEPADDAGPVPVSVPVPAPDGGLPSGGPDTHGQVFQPIADS